MYSKLFLTEIPPEQEIAVEPPVYILSNHLPICGQITSSLADSGKPPPHSHKAKFSRISRSFSENCVKLYVGARWRPVLIMLHQWVGSLG